ncbi:hypothetical protein MHW47_05925 [Streptomyces sp. OfavH-34-F]|uniref:hypothetical protein n=1 Tax=Streptomyces sp. OfavH-34-F TaxID=2917760 RepID=UPI001EF256FE|nr:hypothetical protein [Streptomyces sp. OfavH-34-F]MCG7523979.1 hypothetical protein [Streptomyces sp. OfavH-34-F]
MNERSPVAADRPRPGRAPAVGGLLTPAEAALIHCLRQYAAEVDPTSEPVLEGWAYPSPFHLLLDVGRLFTPAPLPPAVAPLLVTFCYTNAVQTIADQEDPALVYVEGFASCTVDSAVHHAPHAWATDGTHAIDPTWPADSGCTYLGIPFADPEMWPDPQYGDGILQQYASLLPILREGLPADAVADIGRALPHWVRRLRSNVVNLASG